MQGLLELGRIPARVLYRAGETLWTDHVSVFLLFAIAFQALLGLIGVLIMRRLLPAADDHLRWPPGRSYAGLAFLIGVGMGRSEEHTSELQSLMRISSAVFCLTTTNYTI